MAKKDVKTIENEVLETKTDNVSEDRINEKEFVLSNGTKCLMKRCKALVVIRCRKMANDEEMFYPHFIAATTTFDGKKLTANDILDFDVDDYVLLEYHAKEFAAPKNL